MPIEWSSHYKLYNVWTGFVEDIEVAQKPFYKFPYYFIFRDKDYSEIKVSNTYGYELESEAKQLMLELPSNAKYAELKSIEEPLDDCIEVISLT